MLASGKSNDLTKKIIYDGTVELINRKVIEKFRYVLNAFDIIKKIMLMMPPSQKKILDESLKERFLFVNLLENDIKQLSELYEMEMNDVLAKYYQCEDPSQEEGITREFHRRLSVENFLPRLDEIAKKAEIIIEYSDLVITGAFYDNSEAHSGNFISACPAQSNSNLNLLLSITPLPSSKLNEKGNILMQNGCAVEPNNFALQLNNSILQQTNTVQPINSATQPINSATQPINSAPQLNNSTLQPINSAPQPNNSLLITRAISDAKKELAKSFSIDVIFTSKKRDYEECSCGKIMTLNHSTSELYCPDCQEIRENMGISYEDIVGESTRGKSGSYDPNKHLSYWLTRIQALEKMEPTPEHLSAMKEVIERDSIQLTNVHEMRKILKELKITTYNEHAPLLMKILTGISPPTLNPKLLRRISIKFNRIMELIPFVKNAKTKNCTMSHNRSATAGNRPYYPHFIYAIFNDEIDISNALREYDDVATLTRLKKYIHLQSDETIAKNDSLYKKICELDAQLSAENSIVPLLKFRQTIKPY